MFEENRGLSNPGLEKNEVLRPAEGSFGPKAGECRESLDLRHEKNLQGSLMVCISALRLIEGHKGRRPGFTTIFPVGVEAHHLQARTRRSKNV